MILAIIAPAFAGPGRVLKAPGTVITNATNLTSYRWIDDSTGKATGLRIDGFKLRYGRAGIRIGGTASDIVIRNGECTTKGVTKGSDLPVCIDLRGTVSNVLIEGVRAYGHRMVYKAGTYTNGDGFSTEQNVKRVTYRETIAENNSDGGYDDKADDVLYDRTVARDNSRNYRLWGTGQAKGCRSEAPRGSHLWTAKDQYQVRYRFVGCTFVQAIGRMTPIVSGEGAATLLEFAECRFEGFAPKTPFRKGKVTLAFADASCQPDAQGYVVNSPPIVVAAPAGFDAGEALPDTNGDGVITLSNRKADQHKLPRGTVLRALGGTRYEVVR